MKKMIVCLGELIVDLIALENNKPLWAVERFEKHLGGSPANVAIGLHHRGIPVSLWSRVGTDSLGKFLLEELKKRGLSQDNVSLDPTYPTKIALTGFSDDFERFFEIHNRKSADQQIRIQDVDLSILDHCRIFHFGGAALLGEVTSSTVIELLSLARERGAIISFDPNIPVNRIRKTSIISRFKQVLRFVDVLKTTSADLPALFDEQSPQIIVDKNALSLLAITDGASGSRLVSAGSDVHFKANPNSIVDTTGAGDSFLASILSRINNMPLNRPLESLQQQDLLKWGHEASGWAEHIIKYRGATTGYLFAQEML